MRWNFLVFSISMPLFVGFAGSFFTVSEITTWYASLNKPFFNPPNIVFGPVWTTLYILMGISLYLVLKEDKTKKTALAFYGAQLILNFLWSYIFFGLHNILAALFVIILLLISIFFTIFYFYKLNKISAYLLLPYILWVSFATLLNLSIYLLNS